MTTVPRREIHWLVDRMHVGTTDLAVARDLWTRGLRTWTHDQRRDALALALARHHQNRGTYMHVTHRIIVGRDCAACHHAARL